MPLLCTHCGLYTTVVNQLSMCCYDCLFPLTGIAVAAVHVGLD